MVVTSTSQSTRMYLEEDTFHEQHIRSHPYLYRFHSNVMEDSCDESLMTLYSTIRKHVVVNLFLPTSWCH